MEYQGQIKARPSPYGGISDGRGLFALIENMFYVDFIISRVIIKL